MVHVSSEFGGQNANGVYVVFRGEDRGVAKGPAILRAMSLDAIHCLTTLNRARLKVFLDIYFRSLR